MIEVCDINPICLLDIEALETEYHEVTVLKNSCLSNCTICAKNPYAFVDGEIMTAETPEQLLENIKQYIHNTLIGS